MKAQRVARLLAHTAAIAVLLVATPAWSARRQNLDLGLGLSTFYDDNILQYSHEQLRIFESGLRPDRYSISTSDDAVFVPTFGLTWEADRGGGRRRGLYARGTFTLHAVNGTADYRSARFAWREQWRRDQRLLIAYSHLWNYYLRQLSDEDAVPVYSRMSRYQRAIFDMDAASASWMQPLTRNTSLEFIYRFEYRGYNPTFLERDASRHIGMLEFAHGSLARGARFEVRGGYWQDFARADDGDTEPPQSDDVDVSFHGLLAGARMRLELARTRSLRLYTTLDYALEMRHFDSDRPADRYHYLRNDILNAGGLELRLVSRAHWSAGAFYHIETNDAQLGAVAPPGTDSGSYHQNQIGVNIEWTHRLWRSAAPSGEEKGDDEQ